ncbi:Dyp-type peroxidase [Spirosoma litoris]
MKNLLLTETNVSTKDPRFKALLENLQGNILKHHGRTHAYHIFVQFIPEKADDAKSWIKSFAETRITSAIKQLGDSEKRNANAEFNGGIFRNISLSYSGYTNLGIEDVKIPSSDNSFLQGIKGSKYLLKDTPEYWDIPFQNSIDALIIVADSNVSTASDDKDQILREINSFSVITHVQKGKILRNKSGIGIEHFGYADGVSQPSFLENTDLPATQWDDNGALLSTLLVEDTGTDIADSFGSYLVFRKLEQNVKAFKHAENQLPVVKDTNGYENDELAGAMLVGRFEDGSEVVNNSIEKGISQADQLVNDFDYSDDINGLKCPFHAHIRVVNPRTDIHVSKEFVKSIRLTRRGIPYNDIGRDEFNLEDDQPTGGVGLLFQAYQSSIEKQFEFIQSRWANDGDIGKPNDVIGRLVGQDGIIGQGGNTTVKKIPIQWGLPAVSNPIVFRDFVTTKGGEYFFTPSLSFLKTL